MNVSRRCAVPALALGAVLLAAPPAAAQSPSTPPPAPPSIQRATTAPASGAPGPGGRVDIDPPPAKPNTGFAIGAGLALAVLSFGGAGLLLRRGRGA